MTIAFNKASVLLSDSGPDIVMLHTSLPCPFVKKYIPSQPPLIVQFDATADTGIDYCREHLNIEPEIINTRLK